MNLVADECVDRPIVEALRGAGHEVLSVAELSAGIPDDEVLALAATERALLLTQDTDFGELVFRLGQASSGVLLIRLAGLAAAEKAALVLAALEHHGSELPGAFGVLDATQLRIRAPSA